MDGMTAAHARTERRDLAWGLALIVASGLLEVWGSWLQVGAVSGFPKLSGMTTGWVLPVTAEAYWAIALAAWLVCPAGLRSRRFAMWTAGLMFVLSLAGQEADHLVAFAHRTVPPVGVVMLVTALPLLAIALIAVLIHLRHLDRAAADKAARALRDTGQRARQATAEAARITELEARLAALASDLDAERAGRENAQREAAEALTRAEDLTRKLAAKTAQAKRSRTAQGVGRKSAHDDLTAEFRALDELEKDPALRGPRQGGELARRLGVSPATGRRLHAKLTAPDAVAQ